MLHSLVAIDIRKRYDLLCNVFVVFASCDKLWELAAAEVQGRETGGGEEDGGETVSERTVFLIGSKAAVCFTFIGFYWKDTGLV